MALHGQLTLAGHHYDVVECEYEFRQNLDDTGKPTSRTHGGVITFVIPSTSDDDQLFYHWMFNKTQTFSGEFKFIVYTTRNRTNYKTVKFTKAYCVGLKDYFNDNDSKLMYTTITLSAETIQVGRGAFFSNEWS